MEGEKRKPKLVEDIQEATTCETGKERGTIVVNKTFSSLISHSLFLSFWSYHFKSVTQLDSENQVDAPNQ